MENIKKGSFAEERAKGKKAQAQEARKKFSLKELVERELLSCVLHNPRYLDQLKKLEINAEKFTEEPYREIAATVFQLEQQGKEISAAALASYFSDREMHKLIVSMALPDNDNEDPRVEKIFRDCSKKIRALCWAEERKRLIKSLQNTVSREELSAKLQRIRDLKKWEEGLYRSGEGEDFDV